MDITEAKIVEQLTENTGRHICDSGGAYGRHFERNAGKSFAELAKDPVTLEAHVYKHTEPHKLELLGYVKLAAYMKENLTYRQDLQDAFHAWVEKNEETTQDMYETEQVFTFAQQFATKYDKPEFTYTYNQESALSQDIQFITFEWTDADGCDVKAALVSTHNGCDARGGFSTYCAYEIDHDHYLGDCTINGYSSESQQWDESGINQSYPDKGPGLFDLPVHEFEYESRLKQDIENLSRTNLDSPELVAKMTAQDKLNAEEAFNEFCEALEDYSIVVYNREAYFTAADGPEKIYGDSYSLCH